MASSSSHRYDELEDPTSFRLLVLLPGQETDPLSCQISRATTTTYPAYEAVSYVWGSEDDQEEILCGQSSLEITRNLASALRRFRDTATVRVLWTDRVCIDQSNNAERTQQVQLMSKIYENATRVLVWILDHCEELDEGALVRSLKPFWLVAKLPHNDLPSSFTVGSFYEKDSRKYQTYQKQFDLPALGSLELSSLIRFFQLSYFHRAWTYQECFLATKISVYLRKFDISGELLGQVASGYNRISGLVDDDDLQRTEAGHGMIYLLFNKAYILRIPGSDHMTLHRQLFLKRGAPCKDPRDLVYSVLGTITDQVEFAVDYQKPLHVVFADAAMQICRTQDNLDFLRQIWPRKSPVDLPSWIPDWRQTYQSSHADLYSIVYRDGKVPFRCTGATTSDCSISFDSLRLYVSGYLYGTVVAVCSAMAKDRLKFLQFHEQSTSISPDVASDTHEELEEVLPRLQCAGLNIPDGDGGSLWTPQSLAALKDTQGVFTDEELDLKWGMYYRVVSNCKTLQLLTTTKGTRGLGPEHTLPGDSIGLLLGGKTPVLLREQGAGYQFIGACYIDGIMNGEAFVAAAASGAPIRFTLI